VKAVLHTRYGPPGLLRLGEIEKPSPADDEILVKVHAVSVNRSDWEGLTGKPLYARMGGLFAPRRTVLGSDVAGRVEAVGRGHATFSAGDEVFGEMDNYRGGFTEYVCTRAKAWARKPPGMSFEMASAIPQAGVIALQGLRDKVQPGDGVLINGGGGGAGAFAIQLAKSYGAEVTGVDNASKLDFMRSLGADHVIDYAREDFTTGARQYDVILDLVAYRTASAYARALKPQGRYYAVGGSLATFLQILVLGPWFARVRHKHVRILAVRRNRADLELVTRLCETGRLAVPIGKIYPLEAVPEALADLGEGRAQGKLVITVASD